MNSNGVAGTLIPIIARLRIAVRRPAAVDEHPQHRGPQQTHHRHSRFRLTACRNAGSSRHTAAGPSKFRQSDSVLRRTKTDCQALHRATHTQHRPVTQRDQAAAAATRSTQTAAAPPNHAAQHRTVQTRRQPQLLATPEDLRPGRPEPPETTTPPEAARTPYSTAHEAAAEIARLQVWSGAGLPGASRCGDRQSPPLRARRDSLLDRAAVAENHQP
ncbi:MAG UNVERIFIED_CONTAM: hypothetical protein LVR18_24830 [Planctomycetaceae bacterium]